MARGVNKVILIGNLGADPEIRYTTSGAAVGNMNIATTDAWKDKNSGERQEKTEWHRLVVFGKTAEIAGQYLRKGGKIYVEGRLQTRKWQGQDGQDRYTTEVVVNDLQMLDGRGGQGQGQGAGAPAANSTGASQGGGQNPPPREAHTADGADDFDGDIPF